MPEQRNYRFAADPDLMVGTPQEGLTSLVSPSGTARATSDAVLDVMKDPGKAIDKILEQGRQIASNKQKLISTIIKPMKGLDDKPPASGGPSPAEVEADKIIGSIKILSSLPEEMAIAMILEVWPTWQANGNTWDTFIAFIGRAASVFKNPQDVIEWSKKLFASMQDGAPVFTPEYIMSVALDGILTRNFTNYQNLLLSLPFYKSIWSNKPVDTSTITKSVDQIGTLMQAVQTPTEDMKEVLDHMKAKNNLLSSMNVFYKSMLTWVRDTDKRKMYDAAKLIKGRAFETGALFQRLIEIEMQKKALRETIGNAMRGENVVNPPGMQRKNSHKLFKTVLAAPPATAASAPASAAGSTLTTTEQLAMTEAMAINRKELLFEARKKIIENNINQINSMSEQKAKGLSGDLNLFSSFVNSGNVVKKIDDTIRLIEEQFKDAELIKKISKDWANKHTPKSSENEAVSAKRDTLNMNEMKYIAEQQNLKESSLSLKIQRIVLPKEIEYFELKQDYDTNLSQLEAPISALMVNSLVTTRDPRTGKLTTVNKRFTRPIAIKSAWETGKKIVALLMEISQALQAGTSNTELGRAMFKNASNYYKAAVKQEVENNKMLMDNLAKTGIGGGQVNYTPVAVGKK